MRRPQQRRRPTDTEEWFRTLAAARMGGVAPDQLLVSFQNFAEKGVQGVFSKVNGTSAIATGDRRQVISSGVGAGTHEVYWGPGTATDPTSFLTGTTPKYMIGGYFNMTTTISATTKIGVALVNPNGGQDKVVIGGAGGVSTANWSVFGRAGSNLNTGVAIDANDHRFLLWRDGTNGWFQLDNTVPVACDARPDVAGAPYVIAQETGAAAGNRSIGIVWAGFACVRP